MDYKVRSELWHHWLSVAEEAAVACAVARDANPGPEVEPAFGQRLESEMRQAMLAICGAAAALEAFTESLVVVEPNVRPPRAANGKKAPAYSRIAETWKRAFTLMPSALPELRARLKTTFELRNAALHPPSDFVTPGLHPAFNVAIDTRMLWFRVENAVQIPPFARNVIQQLVTQKKPRYESVREWAGRQIDLLDAEDPLGDPSPTLDPRRMDN